MGSLHQRGGVGPVSHHRDGQLPQFLGIFPAPDVGDVVGSDQPQQWPSRMCGAHRAYRIDGPGRALPVELDLIMNKSIDARAKFANHLEACFRWSDGVLLLVGKDPAGDPDHLFHRR